MHGLPEIDLAELTARFTNAYSDERQLADFAVIQLSRVAAGMLTPGGYATSIVQRAGDLATNNGDFVRLVGAVFAEPSSNSGNVSDAIFNTSRAILGGGSHPLGSPIEQTQAALYQPGQEDVGFNGWITEDSAVVSTITHHFGEFLRVGFHADVDVAVAAAWAIDNLSNRADLTSSLVAISLGHALATFQTNPAEAAHFITVAMTDPRAEAIMTGVQDQSLQSYAAFQDVMAQLWGLARSD